MTWLRDLSTTMQPGQPIYVMLYAAAIIFFCFFYTALVFDPKETADNLRKSGAFIPGRRPGEQTARYIDDVMTRLTVFGAGYIALVCLLPEFMIVSWNVPFYFGGTSLLIIVVVTMDFHGASAIASDVASVRGTVEEGQPERIRASGAYHDDEARNFHMKVRASVKRLCRNCKIIRRRGTVRVICKDARHKQRQG